MPSNREMVELWNGEATSAWALHPERYDEMLAPLGRLALAKARLRSGERVLDVGCGGGQLALEAAAQVGPDGHVAGADIAAPLLEVARRRAAEAGLGQVDFVEADAQTHAFATGHHDAVISRFGVMFFDDPTAAFTNLLATTRPGGRLSFVAWQEAAANEWVMTAIGATVPHVGVPQLPPPGAPGPFAFADGDRVRTILSDAGWEGVEVEAATTTILVGGSGSVDTAMAFYVEDAFGRAILGDAAPDAREAAIASLREALAPHESDDGVRLGAAVWVVTAHKPG